MSEDASKRDALFRTLYLRREYGVLAAYSRQTAANMIVDNSDDASSSLFPSAAVAGADAAAISESTATEEQVELHTLRDVVLLPPPDAVGRLSSSHAAVAPLESSAQLEYRQRQQQQQAWQATCWRGLVYVRHRSSPWYGAVFGFLVHFPERYPFDCPTILFEHSMRSHPLLGGHHQPAQMRAVTTPQSSSLTTALDGVGVRVPFFDSVYCSTDPMRVSVMALVLRHVKRFLYPSEWPAWWVTGGAPEDGPAAVTPSPAAPIRINRMLARRDVHKYGLHSRGPVLGQPYTDLLADEVSKQLLRMFEEDATESTHLRRGQRQRAEKKPRLTDTDELGDAVVLRWSEWYNRVLLPTILSLP